MWKEIGHGTPRELDEADPVYARWARARLRDRTLVGWIAQAPDGTPAASGCLWVQQIQPYPGGPSGKRPYLLSMFTEPAHRGNGLAARIVREAVRWTRRHGHPAIALHAAPMGKRIYERLGFERTWEMRLRLDKPAAGARKRRPSSRRVHAPARARSRR